MELGTQSPGPLGLVHARVARRPPSLRSALASSCAEPRCGFQHPAHLRRKLPPSQLFSHRPVFVVACLPTPPARRRRLFRSHRQSSPLWSAPGTHLIAEIPPLDHFQLPRHRILNYLNSLEFLLTQDHPPVWSRGRQNRRTVQGTTARLPDVIDALSQIVYSDSKLKESKHEA
jgi:hypothetical protein